MAGIEVRERDGLAYREAVPEGAEAGAPVLLVHGFPESSRMWLPLMEALAGAGRRAVAPDLYGFGDSDAQESATFEANLAALASFHADLDLGRVALMVHDWGGFVGLAWACEHPEAVDALVISNTGFFSDGRWHGVAEAIRGEQGPALLEALDRDGFAGLLRGQGDAFDDADIDAYWEPFAEGRGRQATLDFYRSMDFSKLARWDGRLAELGVPTLVLWGERDEFAPLSGANRFQREIPGARLEVVEGAGHFVYDQEPERCARAVVEFLSAR
jgi:pimeloyl-ACP methyl ester carboxylesterase